MSEAGNERWSPKAAVQASERRDLRLLEKLREHPQLHALLGVLDERLQNARTFAVEHRAHYDNEDGQSDVADGCVQVVEQTIKLLRDEAGHV